MQDQVLDQDRVNREVYFADDAPRSYDASRGLYASEAMALLKYQATFAHRDVLDMGVGTGRTTAYLASLARRYVAVDYSPVMVQHLRAAMPHIDVRQADLRDLSIFESSSFDFILESCNVIDAVLHEHRLLALREARRVLRPGGILMFSSHNRSLREALRGPRLARSRNPVTEARHVAHYLRSLVNHARIKHLRRFEAEYALLNDEGREFALLHYYITRDAQRRQLDRIGFRLLDVFATSGRIVKSSEVDSRSPSLLYVSERSAIPDGRGVPPCTPEDSAHSRAPRASR
jgi:SAM-dependent methyltransferase